MSLQFNPYPLEPYLNKIRSEQERASMFPNAVAGGIGNALSSFTQARQQAIERERQNMLNKIMLQKEQREQEQHAMDYEGVNGLPPLKILEINNKKEDRELMRLYRQAQISSMANREETARAKEERTQDKENSLLQGQIQKADLIIGKVDQALPMVSNLSAGFGSIFSNIPMTSAKNLEATIQTIKANLGFQQLQEMRASSPTGGALGQVSDREIGLLTSAVASLDQAQSPQQLRDRLQEIKDSYMRWKENALKASTQTGQIQPQSRKSATNPKTGEKIYSDDGGLTWHK